MPLSCTLTHRVTAPMDNVNLRHMKPSGRRAQKRRGYHHGNLREALLKTARKLIAKRGPAGFTLLEAARAAGVSPAAPYRHFKDRDALLTEVAKEGFAEFGRRLSVGMRNPRRAFEHMGTAYLSFAHEQPEFYQAMFSTPGGVGARTGKKNFEVLRSTVAKILGRNRTEAEARLLALQIWALTHGIALLAATGQLRRDIAPIKVLKAGTQALILGSKRKDGNLAGVSRKKLTTA